MVNKYKTKEQLINELKNKIDEDKVEIIVKNAELGWKKKEQEMIKAALREMENKNKTKEQTINELKKKIDEDKVEIIVKNAELGWKIKEQEITEDSLRESEAKYRTLVEGADLSIFVVDKNGEIVFINKFGASQFGGLPKNYIGKTIWQLFPKEIADTQMNDIKKVIKTGKPITTEWVLSINGEEYWYDSSIHPFKKVDNKLYSVLVIAADITERKKLQEQLIQSEKLSAVSKLAANIAHEFKNILTIIKGFTLTAITNKNLPEDILKMFNTINEQTEMGEKIITAMLRFAKPKSPKKKASNIHYVINKIIELQENIYKIEKIKIVKNFKATKKVNTDVGQMEHVFLNLLLNAQQAIKPKGKGTIYISTKEIDNKIEISFSDTGIGMSQETKSKIFTPFFTTKNVNNKNFKGIKGSGLGLVVTHNIIKNHNGTITVKSESGAGSTFTITLPIE